MIPILSSVWTRDAQLAMNQRRLLLVALTLAMSQGCRPAPGEPGLKWTKRKTTGIDLSAIAWSGSQFVAIGCCSTQIYPDGLMGLHGR